MVPSPGRKRRAGDTSEPSLPWDNAQKGPACPGIVPKWGDGLLKTSVLDQELWGFHPNGSGARLSPSEYGLTHSEEKPEPEVSCSIAAGRLIHEAYRAFVSDGCTSFKKLTSEGSKLLTLLLQAPNFSLGTFSGGVVSGGDIDEVPPNKPWFNIAQPLFTKQQKT
ncbi:hypothetical protein NDU88_005240 [Pleurodeles waltl]|uniref:Uncharacterized protein n=1 Tax=Pleurodeles waltl TaxID=8319 RepID=A0AAV7L0N3_PLEWA|nr:hypothetical protein NDU88_005240 [Pleurodeles waltl]